MNISTGNKNSPALLEQPGPIERIKMSILKSIIARFSKKDNPPITPPAARWSDAQPTDLRTLFVNGRVMVL